jgi:hypothetical protein
MPAKAPPVKENEVLNEKPYFPIGKIKADRDYYALSLFSDDGVNIYYDVHGTLWTGFAEVNGKQAELRKADIVLTEPYANHWKERGEPFSVVNDVDEFIDWFFKVGGHGFIQATVAEELMASMLEPSPAFIVGSIGFTGIRRIEEAAFKRAPTSKLRMQIVERDLYRCRICGRRPADHVDLELHVHHIRPFARDGLTIEENLITLCHTCHAGLDPHFRPQLFDLLPEEPDRPRFPASSSDYLKRVGLYQKAILRE